MQNKIIKDYYLLLDIFSKRINYHKIKLCKQNSSKGATAILIDLCNCLNKIERAINLIQSNNEAAENSIPFSDIAKVKESNNRTYDNQILSNKGVINDVTMLDGLSARTSSDCSVKKKNNYKKILRSATDNNFHLFNDIPFEIEYPIDIQHPEGCIKNINLSDFIKRSIQELKSIIYEGVKYRKILLPNGKSKIQIATCRSDPNMKKLTIFSRRNYTDLLFEHLLLIFKSLQNDLNELNKLRISGTAELKFELVYLRNKKRSQIQRNHRFFKNWDSKSNSFISLKARYGIRLIFLSGLAGLAVIVGSSFLNANPLFVFFKGIDIIIISILYFILIYLLYLVFYSLAENSGQFDLAHFMNQKSKTRSQKKVRTTTFNDHVKTYIDQLEQEELEILNDYFKTKSIEKLKAYTNTLFCKKQHTKAEKEIIQKILPKQLIIIPAVNDIHLVELVRKKLEVNNYPNTEYLIALEERDRISSDLILEAEKKGILPLNIKYNFGVVELANLPGYQRKPENKPKNVNKAICKYLDDIEYDIYINRNRSAKLPDFVMVWDLEDDPGPNQVWSMILANKIISSTVQELFEFAFEGDKLKYSKSKELHKALKKIDKNLYSRIRVHGIEPERIIQLYNSFVKEESKYPGSIDNISFIDKLQISADKEFHLNTKKELNQKKECSTSSLHNTIRTHSLRRSISKLQKKYSSPQNFAKNEFLRRTLPADTQAILVPKLYGENPWSILEWSFWFDLVLPGLLRFRYDTVNSLSLLTCVIMGFILNGPLGAFIGGFISIPMGYLIGRFLMLNGIDTRNKIGLSFSAGTSNNYRFDVLVNYLNIYPEYNIAEDWSLALKLAKNKFRSHLVCGYNTPTIEDSLAPLYKPMWNQHSRWIGGHFQSFPQVFVKVKDIINEYGLTNWGHSFIMIVLFSLTPILSFYVILKFLIYASVWITNDVAATLNLTGFESSTGTIQTYIDSFSNWLFRNEFESFFFFVFGFFLVVLLGMIPIIKTRKDDHLLVQKSIDELKRSRDELKTKESPELNSLYSELELFELNYLEELKKHSNAMEHNEFKNHINKYFKDSVKNQSELKYIKLDTILQLGNKMPQKMSEKRIHIQSVMKTSKELLDQRIETDLKKLNKRIERLEEGKLFGFVLGMHTYSKIHRLTLNFTTPYYYFQSLFSVGIYLKQLAKDWDNQWRQTGHRNTDWRYIQFVNQTMLK